MQDPTAARPVRAWRGALACALIAACVRLAVILMPPADLAMNGFVWNEEWLRGNVAFELLHGRLVPLEDHVVGLWGGVVAVGALAAPLFALFGPVLPALRMACLPFPMIEAAAAFALLHRFGGQRAAWTGGLLVAVAPPGPVLDSVLAQGTHQHFHALVLAWIWFASEVRARRAGALAHASLAASLGLMLYFGGGILVALAAGLELLLDRSWWRSPRIVAARVGGFLAGCIPLVVARASSPEKPLGIYGHGPVGLAFGGGEDPLGRLAGIFASNLPEAFWVRGPTGHAIGVAWMLALLGLWAAAAWNGRRERDPALVALLVYPIVFVVVWTMSPLVRGSEDHVIALRYFLPLIGVLALTSALTIARIGRARPRFATAIAAAFVALSIATLVPKLRPSASEETWRTPGARPHGVARVHLWRNGADAPALEEFLDRVDARRSGAERQAVLRETERLLDVGVKTLTRLRERGEPGEDPAVWSSALEMVREREKSP